MYNFLSLLIGIIISIMVAFNGKLSCNIGTYSSLVIIHTLGFAAVLAIMFCKNIKISFKNHLPLYLYSAGVISVFTVLFNNLSFEKLGLSLPVALGLLGQTLTSMIYDKYGFLGIKKIKFNKKKVFGLLTIVFGVCIMTFFN